ncbi:hypothetical protein PCK1_000049 [Pneumocystis canis]|nr:hypothetical protein PCK1_000049 [Pneumocystis canis]
MNNKDSRPLGIAASKKKEKKNQENTIITSPILTEKLTLQKTPTFFLEASPDDDDLTQLEALYRFANEQNDSWFTAALLRGTLHECNRLICLNEDKLSTFDMEEAFSQVKEHANTISERLIRIYIIYATTLLDLAQLANEGVDVRVNGQINDTMNISENDCINVNISLKDTDSTNNSIDYENLIDNQKLMNINSDHKTNNINNTEVMRPESVHNSSISTTLMLIDAAINRCNAGLSLNLSTSDSSQNNHADQSTLQCLRGKAKLIKLMHQAYRPYNSIKSLLKSAMKDLDASNLANTYRTITHLLHWVATIADDCEDILEKNIINNWVASKWHILLKENELNAEALKGLGFIELSISNAYLEPIEDIDEIEETAEVIEKIEAHMNSAITYFMKAYDIQKDKGVSADLLIMIAEAKISLANLKSEDKQSEGYKDALKYLREIDPSQSHQLPDYLWDILNELDAS